MSSDNNKRVKLKPNPSNKVIKIDENAQNAGEDSKRGFKRPNSAPEYSTSKKRCFESIHPPTKVVNLANNRLKKLKENIRESTNLNNNVVSTNISSKELNNLPSTSKNSQNEVSPSSKELNNLPSTSKNSYNEVSPSTSKGVANDRLKKIKEANKCDLNSSSSESTLNMENIASTSQTPIKNSSFSENRSVSKVSNSKTDFKNMSSRLLKIKQNTEEINKTVSDFTSPSIRLVKIKENVSSLNYNNNNCDFKSPDFNNSLNVTPSKNSNNFRSPMNKVESQINNNNNNLTLNTLNRPWQQAKEFGDNYNDKMAMTANWIRCHQSISESSVEIDNSINKSLNNSSIEGNCCFDTSEEMEWTNAEPISEIFESPNQSTIQNDELNSLKHIKYIKKKEKFVCVVVDTNIFISELYKLTDIINLKVSGGTQPLIYIPWMVVTELDDLKDRSRDKNLKQKAINAVKFINKVLSEGNPRVKGQSVVEMGTQSHIGTSPDDKIIGCCIQAVENYESVILMTNDVNLKNKAMINNIPVSSCNEIIMKIMSKILKTTKTQRIMQKMGVMCSEIVCVCAKEAYGDVWMKMDMLSSPPWSLLECLKRFKKYWVAVFQEKILKHFIFAVEKLEHLLTNKDICDDSEQYVEFVKASLNLCIFLKDIEEFRGMIENIITDISKLA